MRKIRKYILKYLPVLLLPMMLLAAKPAQANWVTDALSWGADAAGAMLARRLGIDTEDNCSTPTVDKIDCMFCDMFKVLFNAGSTVAAKSYDAFHSELGQLVLVFLAVSLALIILRNIATMGSKDPSALLNDIFTKTFVGVAIYIIVAKDYYNVLNLTLTPVFDTGLGFVKSSGTTCAHANGVVGYASAASSGSGGGLPLGVGTSIVCAVEDIEKKINMLFEYGEYAFCQGNGPQRMFHVLPNPIYIIDGILLYIAGIFFMVAYPWVMADAVLQFGIAMALLPFAVCGYAFQGTRNYLPKVFQWILHSLFTFMFMAILIMCVLGYINALLVAATSAAGEVKELFENPNTGLAFYGPNMLKIIFILVIGWAYMPVTSQLAEKFSGGSMGIQAGAKIGAAVKNTIDSKVRKAADWGVGVAGNAAKTTARVTKRRAQAGIRQATMFGVNRLGRTNTSGGKTLKILGYKFATEKNADGSQMLRREFKSFTGRTHIMVSDKYSTTKIERTKSGKIIKSETKFKHNFIREHLLDKKTGNVNLDAIKTLLNSPKGKDPEYRKMIMQQLAIDMYKARTGKDVGKYFTSRNVQFDPDNPYKLRIEQVDNTGKTFSLDMDINATTGQVAIDALRQRDKNSIESALTTGRKRVGRKLNIAGLNSLIRKAGHQNADGSYTFSNYFVSYTAKKDANDQQYYERETRRFGFFGPKVKKTYTRDGVEIERDTSKKLGKHNDKRNDIENQLNSSFAAMSSTGDRTATIKGGGLFSRTTTLKSHTDAATGEVTYSKEQKAGLFGQKTKRTTYKNNEVITEYLNKEGDVVKRKTKHVDATKTKRKGLDGSSAVSYGNSHTDTKEAYSGFYERDISNGLLNMQETGRKTAGDIRDGSAQTAGVRTTVTFSEYAQKGHDDISDRVGGNQIIEENGTIARDLDPAYAGEDGYKGDLLYGLDKATGEKINGKNLKDYVKDDVLVKMRKKRVNKISTQDARTRDLFDIADFNGNIIGQVDSSGTVIGRSGTRIGSVSNGVAYDSLGHVIGQVI